MALHLSGVVFRHNGKPPRLKPWEGPFADPHQQLPQAPDVAARRRGCNRRTVQRWPRRARRQAEELAPDAKASRIRRAVRGLRISCDRAFVGMMEAAQGGLRGKARFVLLLWA